MARGWESKSVEDQIAASEGTHDQAAQPEITAAQRERANRRETVRLNRARTLQSLQTACDRRYRALLEETLAHLNAELAALED